MNEKLNPEQIAYHIQATQNRIARLNEDMANIMKSIMNEQQLLDFLRSNVVFKIAEYDDKDTWFNKAKFILSRKGELLTANDMIGLISNEYEPELKTITSEELAKIKSNLAGQLKMGLDKTFKRMKISGENNFYYGLISWFDGDNCRQEYLPGPEIDDSDLI